MKKFLAICASLGLIASTSITVISCGLDDKIYENPDHVPDDVNQNELAKKLVSNSMQARIQAAILTDTYHLNHTETTKTVFRLKTETEDKQDLKSAFDTYFEGSSLYNATGTDKVDLYGNLGYQGGIIDLITDELQIPDMIKGLLNLDFSSQQFKNQISGLLSMVSQFLQGIGINFLVEQLPDLLKLIPDDLLNSIDHSIQVTLPRVIQKAIDEFFPQKDVDSLFTSLIKGTDLTRFENSTVSQVFDAFFVNLTNFLGYGIDPAFKEFSDQGDINFDEIGKFWFDNRTKFNSFDYNLNIPVISEKLISFLGILNLLLSSYKTVDNALTDDTHLFDAALNNDEFVLALQSKTMKDLNLDAGLKNFQIGSLMSNLIYFFGTGPNDQQRFMKFLYFWLFNGQTDQTSNELPSFWKFSFGLINASDKVNDEVKKQLPNLFSQTIGPRFLQPILSNQDVQKISDNKSENEAYWSLVDSGQVTELAPFFNTLSETLATKPAQVIYSGDLWPIINALYKLGGDVWDLNFIDEIKKVLEPNQKFNATNLLNVRLGKILGLANAPGFPTNDLGLPPNYADYYTSKSLRGLVDELGKVFKMNGKESLDSLKNYTFDFQTLQNLIDLILYDNHHKANRGLIGDTVEALVNKAPIIDLLGYDETAKNLVYQNSVLGQLSVFFVPELSALAGQEKLNLKTDLVGKQDNLEWVLDGIVSILTKLMEPTNYDEFINKVLKVENAFNIQETLKYFKSKNIKSGEYVVRFNLGLVNKTLGKTDQGGIITYRLVFDKTKESDKYQITTFRKD